jgi:predicted  nucleic acid-binding Zn-ribbon protein
MKRNLVTFSLILALGLWAGTFTGCRDYDNDLATHSTQIDNLQERVRILETLKSWAEEQLSTLGSEDADLKKQIDALNEALTQANADIGTIDDNTDLIALENKMNALVAGSTLTVAQIEAKLKTLADADYQKQIDALTAALVQANAEIATLGATGEELAALKDNVSALVNGSTLTVSQIEAQLKALTNADYQGQIDALKDALAKIETSAGNNASQELAELIEKVAALQAYIDGLPADLVGESDLEAWFQANHGSEISDLEDALRALIAAKADASALTSLEETVDALEETVAELAAEIESMALSQIQSIVYLPEFADGRKPVTGSTDGGQLTIDPFTMDFLVTPASGAALFDGAGSFEGIFNSVALTRAMAGTVPATFVSATDEGVLTVSFTPEALTKPQANEGLQIALRIALESGENLSSQFVNLEIASTQTSFALRPLEADALSDLETRYGTTLRFEMVNTGASLEELGITSSQTWALGSQSEAGIWTTYGSNASTITAQSDLDAGEIYLCYDATEEKAWLLVGPQVNGMAGADLFVMNAEGTDKAVFPFDENTVALCVSDVTANYNYSAPSIQNVSCTMPLPGDVITLTGVNLQHAGAIWFPSSSGEVQATDYTLVDNSTLRVTVPVGAGDKSGTIRMESNGDVLSPTMFYTEGLFLHDFTEVQTGANNNTAVISDPDAIVLLTGLPRNPEYVLAIPSVAADFAVASSNSVSSGASTPFFRFLAGKGLQNVIDNPANSITGATELSTLAIQFDVYMPQPWTSGAIVLKMHKDMGTTDGSRVKCLTPSYKGGAYTFGGWETFTIKFSDFRTLSLGTLDEYIASTISVTQQSFLAFCNYDVNSDYTPSDLTGFQFFVANVRLVPLPVE